MRKQMDLANDRAAEQLRNNANLRLKCQQLEFSNS